jgi:DNA-binding CsgD family transcriptional regulator
VERLLEREAELAALDEFLQHGGTVLVEGGAGLGKSSLLEVACRRAVGLGHDVLRARGSQLEAGFPFGVVRQLFERRLTSAEGSERDALLAGPAGAVRPLLLGEVGETAASDTSFAVLHGLYWLAANLSDRRPVMIAVDDAHWADEPSLRWLAYLAPRIEGLALATIVALRPGEPVAAEASLDGLRVGASTVVRPALLSKAAVGAIIDAALGERASDDMSDAVWLATGGNPLYVTELLRAVEREEGPRSELDPGTLLASGREGVSQRVLARVRALDPRALELARALAVMGDGRELRHAARMTGLEMAAARRLAARLVSAEVLADDDPPLFIHPVVRDAIEGTLGSHDRDALHRSAAELLDAEGASPGRVAAHLIGVRPAGDAWVLSRLRKAAQAAMHTGAPRAAAAMLGRALVEPPAPADRVVVLREAASAEASAGSATACTHLEEALRWVGDRRLRAEIALEVAEAHAALFRWADAVDVIERALAELGDADELLAARLEGELVVCGLHDARRAARVAPVLERLGSRSVTGSAAEALAVAQGMGMVLAGRPAHEAAGPLVRAIAAAPARAENWDTRAALMWSLVTAEHFEIVDSALEPMLAEAQRSGSARALVAVHSTLGLLKLRLGALPEGDAAARIALRVLQEGDFASGLPFAVTVLADIAVEAGALEEAEALIALLPQEGWLPGLATVLIPAARGRLRLAQGRPSDALADFQACAAMFSSELWGMAMRDVGYLHARAGAARALLRLGQREDALRLALAELDDAKEFGAPCALGIALRVAGLAQGGKEGLELLHESVSMLRGSPALLERAHSLTELGAALRRTGRRADARELLAEALDLAARCGASPLAIRVREELKATGSRPRREWRTGVEALTPSELRIVRLAAEGRTNRGIAHELYVTLKTVEGHLSRAYTKLGIEGRRELARALEGEKTRVPTP